MKFNLDILTALLLATVGMVGCDGQALSPQEEATGPEVHAGHAHDHGAHAASGADCLGESTLSYVNFGRPLLERYCQSCHSSGLSGDLRQGAPPALTFDSQFDVQDRAVLIDRVAAAGPRATNAQMPPAHQRQPTPEERLQLGIWLACGAP